MTASTTVDENVITSDEISVQLKYVEKALTTSRSDVRRRALMEGFLHFGTRFAFTLGMLAGKANHEGPFEGLAKESEKLLQDWMLGKRLTRKADEDDRRAQMAVFLLREESGQLGRLAARCIMALPEGHPQRDIALVHQALLKYLALARTTSDVDGDVLAITDIIGYDLEPHEQTLALIKEGMTLVHSVSDPSFRHDFRSSVLGYYLLLAIKTRDDSEFELQKDWAQKAKEVLDQMRSEEPEFFQTAPGINLTAAVVDLSSTPLEAAAIFASVVDSTDPNDDSYQTAAMIEARYRIGLKDYPRVIKVLSPIVSILEQKYLSLLTDKEIAAAGIDFSSAVWNMAFAHAYLGQWDEAVRYLERGKSLSFRYAGALRQIPSGRRLLKLERKLYALARGVPVEAPEFEKTKSADWLGAGISLKAKILETYRGRRPRISSELLASPSIAEIAKTLAADEAVLVIGVHNVGGTMMVIICHDDVAQPSASFLWKDWPLSNWIPAFAGEKEDGWLYALCAPELNLDGRKALDQLLKEFEKRIGRVVSKCLESKKIRRLAIIPHLWFHLVPFWTMPSMEKYQVTMGASVAHFMQSRQSNKRGNLKALVVADPTGDLPVSLAEADAVEKHIAALNFKVQRLDREAAQENAIVKGLRGATIFHFCGHGRADSDHASRSALLVYPDLPNLPVSAKEPFEPLVSNAQEWQTDGENERSTLIPKFGRLYERVIPENQTMERRIEYGERGTLWGRYQTGTLKQLAEMWTAGDILVEGSLSGSRLVFLSACEVGGGNLSSELDEYSGLPAALQLSGASTIICSLWPVSDALTALYVDLFYKTLARSSVSANVVAIVQSLSSRLRRMKKDEAVRLLNGLRRRTSSGKASFILETYAMRIKKGKQFPFSHPYDWGAFYVTGASTVFLGEETS